MKKLLPLLLLSCVSGGPGLSLPRVEHYDTRRVTKIAVHRDVGQTAGAAYRQALAEELETALCLHGRLAGDTLFVDQVRPAHIIARTLVSIQFPRENPTGCADSRGFVGTVHTHLPAPQVLGIPSAADRVAWWSDSRSVLFFVIVGEVGDGIRVYWELRDGRWGFMIWGS